MELWRRQFKIDPVAALLPAGDPSVAYFTKRDLLGEDVGEIGQIWEQPEATKIIRKQLPDGSWKYPGKILEVYPPHHYGLVEIWKQFRILVDKYELNRTHPAAEKAAEFLFYSQTEEGDIRGMIGNQYATYYTGAITSLLIKAGYADDTRIEKGFQWL